MRIIFLVLFNFCFSVILLGNSSILDSLYNVLDESIEQRARYVFMRQRQIDSLSRELQKTHTDKGRFRIYQALYDKYKSYRMDSAFWAASRCVELAENMKDKKKKLQSDMQLADIMIGTGSYKDGLEMLDRIPHQILDAGGLFLYYQLYHKAYRMMADYAISKKLQCEYMNLVLQYKDSMLSVKHINSLGYKLVLADKLLYENKYEDAIMILKVCYDTHLMRHYGMAIPAIALANVYEAKGDLNLAKRYLAISAIADIQSGTKEYISLWRLANLLYYSGDIDRAYKYVSCSLQDALFANAKYRVMEMSGMMSLISSTYEAKLHQEKKQLTVMFKILSVLMVILLIAVSYIYFQMRRLAAAKRIMADMNAELKQINADLENLNNHLKEANRVKEEYIGYVFNMCTVYIDKQEEFRKILLRKMKTGKIDDLYTTIQSTSFVVKEMKEFFQMFDRVFLNLYPNFVGDFNLLLNEDERIILKDDDLLTPELRIFALIRLGITDSGKIASFLHYSSQTVYNYRLKMRNKSSLSKEEFFQAVQTIG